MLPDNVIIGGRPNGDIIATGGNDTVTAILAHLGFRTDPTEKHTVTRRLSSDGAYDLTDMACYAAQLLRAGGFPVLLILRQEAPLQVQPLLFPPFGALTDALDELTRQLYFRDLPEEVADLTEMIFHPYGDGIIGELHTLINGLGMACAALAIPEGEPLEERLLDLGVQLSALASPDVPLDQRIRDLALD